MNASVREYVIEFIEQKGKLSPDVDISKFDYMDSGHVDSMRMIKFIIELESEFDIELADEEIEDPAFRTIEGITRLIAAKLDS